MNVAATMRRAFQLHHEEREYARAEALYRLALKRDRFNPEILRLLGLCICQQGFPKQGIDYLVNAQVTAPQDPVILANLANAYGALGDHEKALELSDRALLIHPHFPNATYTRGLAKLAMGDWTGGWHDYESGHDSGDRPRRMLKGEKWRGGPLPIGSVLVLWYEQGLGDTLMMARFVKLAKEFAGPGAKVILEVQEELKNLLFGMDGADLIVSQKDDLPPFKYHCSLMSLPYVLGLTPQMAASVWQKPCVKPSPIRVDAWGPAIARHGGIPVGFCTKGNRAHINDRNRSIHDFADMQPLVCGDCLPAKFHSLNYGKGESQHDIQTFDDLAAIMAHMKLIITVDSAVAHLAGAMGKPCWILLPKIGCDFRWMRGTNSSCWYPTATLVRQGEFLKESEEESWLPVVKAVARNLRAVLAKSTV